MDHLAKSITHSQPIYKSPADIHEAVCRCCGFPLWIEWRHVGAAGKQPHLVCHEPLCQTPTVERVPPDAYNDYLDWAMDRHAANVAWVARLEADLPPAEPTEAQRLRWRVQDLEGACLNTAGQLRLIAAGTGLIEPGCYRELLTDAAERLEEVIHAPTD